MPRTPPSVEFYESDHLGGSDGDRTDPELRQLFEAERLRERNRRREKVYKVIGGAAALGGILAVVAAAGRFFADSHLEDSKQRWQPHVAADFAYPRADYVPTCGADSLRATKLLGAVSDRIVAIASSSIAEDVSFTAKDAPSGYYGALNYIVPVSNGQYEINASIASDGKGGYLPDTAYFASISATKRSVSNGPTDFATGNSLSVSLGSTVSSASDGGPNFPTEDVKVTKTTGGMPIIELWYAAAPQNCDSVLEYA